MPELGVGLVYWSALTPLFEDGADVVDVLELEPQSLWEKVKRSGEWHYQQNDVLVEKVQAFQQPKLIHGVGQPLGGLTTDPVEHLDLLRQTVGSMRPAWVSEHLSFNRVGSPRGVEETGFLLPPRQSPAGVRVAADNIDAFRAALGCPVAFETGTTYLQPRDDEMADGEFFRAVASEADCGILLDLHNLWCNELNGRARVVDVIDQVPLERVWEVHVAGGMELNGYTLDAHSSRVHPRLVEIVAEILPRLPNLGALIFEILPEHVPSVGIDGVHRQLNELRAVWSNRPARSIDLLLLAKPPHARSRPDDVAEVRVWEGALAAAIRGGSVGDSRFGDVSGDSGLLIYRELVGDFRRAAAARCLRYTMTAMLLGLGSRQTQEMLEDCFVRQAPDTFAAVEAEHVAQYLESRRDMTSRIPHLAEILAFERALLRATLYDETTDIEWTADPIAIFEALDGGRLPEGLPPIVSRVRVTVSQGDAAASCDAPL